MFGAARPRSIEGARTKARFRSGVSQAEHVCEHQLQRFHSINIGRILAGDLAVWCGPYTVGFFKAPAARTMAAIVNTKIPQLSENGFAPSSFAMTPKALFSFK